ncbi:hypothetical protein KKE14_02525 [Patescibacteria group bacterium]|nr:hypothetical protein [Patescibacteria group bacterium]
MNLEQEKSANSPEQLPSSGIEVFKAPENSEEITSLPTPADVAEEIELAVEPQSSKLPTETAIVQNVGEKTFDLFTLSENKMETDASNARKITERLIEYKKAA